MQITVEVVYAYSDTQRIIRVEVEKNSTLETVIERSGILEVFPEIDLMHQKIGIFGQLKKLSDRVEEGDRIEIYRPLMIDPKEARRKRAK